MPAPQGVVRWPSSKPALAALVEEDDLPLTDSAVDRRAAGSRAGKCRPTRSALLREVWRVLAAGGRLLAVVPNRRGALGAHGHDAVRSRPALFAPARSRTCCARPGSPRPAGAKRSTCRRFRAAGSCARPWPGSAPARRCRRRSPAYISSKRPNRSIAPSRRGARTPPRAGTRAGARSVARSGRRCAEGAQQGYPRSLADRNMWWITPEVSA